MHLCVLPVCASHMLSAYGAPRTGVVGSLNHLMWILGGEPRSSARASPLNPCLMVQKRENRLGYVASVGSPHPPQGITFLPSLWQRLPPAARAGW